MRPLSEEVGRVHAASDSPTRAGASLRCDKPWNYVDSLPVPVYVFAFALNALHITIWSSTRNLVEKVTDDVGKQEPTVARQHGR